MADEDYLWSGGGIPVDSWSVHYGPGELRLTLVGLNGRPCLEIDKALAQGGTVRLTVEKPPFGPGWYQYVGPGSGSSPRGSVRWFTSPPWEESGFSHHWRRMRVEAA